MRARQRWVLAGFALLIAAAGLGWFSVAGKGAAEPEQVVLGRELYRTHCAGCHGGTLEGQPNWQVPLPDGRMPAPSLNAAGHAPHHPESELFRVVKDGMASVNSGRPTDMPAFGDVLSDEEIRAVIAFITASW